MNYSDFIVLLARQRSGTNPLRSVLESNSKIFCFNEVFNLQDKDSENDLLRTTNFFTFVENYADGDVRRLLPDRHDELFVNFLEYLRCFSSKSYLLLDVKYNTTHFMTPPFKRSMTQPAFLDLVMRYEMKVFHLTRKNYLRYVLSTLKSWWSNVYAVAPGNTDYQDVPIRLNIDHVLSELRRCAGEDRLLEGIFSGYPNLFSYDYADIFADDQVAIAPAFLAAVSTWLGVANRFRKLPEFKKQSSLPLSKSIENFSEIESALRGTEYEYCLQDERIYRQRSRGGGVRPFDAAAKRQQVPTPSSAGTSTG